MLMINPSAVHRAFFYYCLAPQSAAAVGAAHSLLIGKCWARQLQTTQRGHFHGAVRRFSTQTNSHARSLATTTVELNTKHAPESSSSSENSPKPKQIPTPPLPRNLAALFMGHAAYMLEKDDSFDPRVSSVHKLHEKRFKWYKDANSKIIKVKLMGVDLVYCADPSVYREILGEKQNHFTNSNSFRDVFGYLFPNSMIVLEGEAWQRVRRIGQKAINRMDLNNIINASIEVVESVVAHGSFKPDVDIESFKVLSLITFDIFHKMMYSMDPKAVSNDPNNPHVKLIKACDTLLAGILHRSFTRGAKWTWGLPLKKNLEVNRARDYINETGRAVINQRRAELMKEIKEKGQARANNLLDGLLLSQDEELMSDAEVLDQVGTFFFGAYETTSNTLLLTLDGLANNQPAQDKLRAELQKAFPNGKEDLAKATLEDLDAITYLRWAIDEAFRLNSTAWGFPRDCIKDVIVGGYELKAGTIVLIDHRSASRDPELWHGQTDLDQFNPERFGKYPMEKLHSLPFGFGSRICLGRRIAMAELKALIAYLMLQYQVLPPQDPSKNLVLETKLGLTCVDGTGYMRFKPLNK